MARFEDGKVTLIMDNKDVETLDWNLEEDRAKILRYADNGYWSSQNKDNIQSWRKTAEDYEKNKDLVDKALGFANRLERIKAGQEEPEGFIADLEKYGIKLTKEEKKEFNDDDLDPVTEKLLAKIDGLEKKLGKFEQSSMNTEATIFNNQSDAAHKELADWTKGKAGYPKYDPTEIEDYMRKNGENAIYHPDVKKQYQLIYKDIHEDKILEAERSFSGLSKEERLAKIKEAQGEKGSNGELNKKPFKAVHGDRNYDAVGKAVLDEMKASGKSFIIED